MERGFDAALTRDPPPSPLPPVLPAQMRPILLKGHTRALTCVIYNADGDLIFTASKDHVPSLWLSDSGERIGTYNGHEGAVWELDCNWDSSLLLSVSADMTARLWEVETGVEVARFAHTGPVRSCQFDEGGKRFVTISDPFGSMEAGKPPLLRVYEREPSGDAAAWALAAELQLPHPDAEGEARCQLVRWMPLTARPEDDNRILTAFSDGTLRVLDPYAHKELQRVEAHEKKFFFSYNQAKTLLLTASADAYARLWDLETFECLKTYRTDRPLNACVISPLKDHVYVGGGQDAMSVTTTAGKQGHFECCLWEMIYEEEVGRIKGHFGPINALAVNPDGRSYCSGSEDGYVRLHHFGADYLERRDPVPEEIEGEG